MDARSSVPWPSGRGLHGRPTDQTTWTREGGPWPGALNWGNVPGLADPPVELHLLGATERLQDPLVAVVGTRQASRRGRAWAVRVAERVVGRGGVVVSGLAAGIDRAAHEAARGRTVAVLGQGLHVPMPAWRRALVGSMLGQGGLLLTELGPGVVARRFTFVVRNRIIAGLAAATVVVEAGEGSGALHTARAALALGRPVWVVPGHPDDVAHRGCNALLTAGARPLLSLTELDQVLPQPAAPGGLSWSGEQSFDDLLVSTGLDAVALGRRLGELELEGLVERLGGDRWRVA